MKRAFQISSSESSDIIFAWTEDHARSLGRWRFWDWEDEFTSVVRVPEYDQYSHLKRVPPLVLIDDYWTLSCEECGLQIDADFLDPDGEELDPVVHENHIFCCQQCADDWIDTQHTYRVFSRQIRAYLINKYPGLYKLEIFPQVTMGHQAMLYFTPEKYAEWSVESSDSVWVRQDWLDSWIEYCQKNGLKEPEIVQ